MRGVTLCDHSREEKLDIQVAESKVVQIAPHLKNEDNDIIVDASSLVLMPSLWELHARVKNNILNSAHISKLLAKAKQSGVGHLCILPDSAPMIDNELMIEFLEHNDKQYTKLIPICSSVNSQGDLAPIATLLHKGAKAIYLDSGEGNTIRRVCEYALINNTPIIANAYDESLSRGCINNHLAGASMGLSGIDPIAQVAQVAKMLEIVRFFKNRVLFPTITTMRSVELINRAKTEQEGNEFYIQTPVHHLLLNDEQCLGFNTKAKLFPPLREEAEREKLLQALIDGKIDMLTSLQSHETKTKKDLPFEEASSGITDIEIFLALCYTHLVATGLISLQKLVELLSVNACRLFNQMPTTIKEGVLLEELVVLDKKVSFVVRNELSIYAEQELQMSITPANEYLNTLQKGMK